MKRQRIDIKKTIKKRIEYRHSQNFFIEKRSQKVVSVELVKNNMSLANNLRRNDQQVIPTVLNKKINVVISAYDCVEYIEECLDSVNAQTYKAEKILLGIDGCKKTLKKVNEIHNKYSNLEVYYSEKNTGPYPMFNSLIALVPDDEYIQIFGADDVMNPEMLEKMSVYDMPMISRYDGVLFFKKELIKLVGGFRDWRCAADSDLLFRLKAALKTRTIKAPLYFFHRMHEKQLSKKAGTNKDSKLRKSYFKIYDENVKSENPVIYIEPTYTEIKKITYNQSNTTMSTLNNYFDKIYCINLKRRPDRWERISKMFEKYNVDVQRVDAFDGRVVGSYNKLHPAQYGCFLSHEYVYKDAIKNGYEKILILEDDVYFDRNINSYDFNQLPEWDILYLGASQAPNTFVWDVEMKDGYYINNKLTYGGFAIAFKLKTVVDVLKNIHENVINEPIDVFLPNYAVKTNCVSITIFPNIIIPDVRNSDISNTNNQITHSKKMRWNLENFDMI